MCDNIIRILHSFIGGPGQVTLSIGLALHGVAVKVQYFRACRWPCGRLRPEDVSLSVYWRHGGLRVMYLYLLLSCTSYEEQLPTLHERPPTVPYHQRRFPETPRGIGNNSHPFASWFLNL